ncbi:MAG: TOBE domain-containing protein [Bacilli bacterium]|nr:TOBE domain-containing protein [Bacilli bacterium]
MNLYDVSYGKGKIDFADNFSLNLPKEASKAVDDFYKDALKKAQEELTETDKTFFERTNYLELISKFEKQLAEEKDLLKKKKTEADLAKAKEELKFCEEVNASRQELLANIEAYKKIGAKKAIPLIFGIRPEDIFLASSNKDDKDASKGFKITVSVAELLGREYFIHSDFQGKDLISKINSKQLIAAGDKLELSFDLAHLHLFDPISKKTIY